MLGKDVEARPTEGWPLDQKQGLSRATHLQGLIQPRPLGTVCVLCAAWCCQHAMTQTLHTFIKGRVASISMFSVLRGCEECVGEETDSVWNRFGCSVGGNILRRRYEEDNETSPPLPGASRRQYGAHDLKWRSPDDRAAHLLQAQTSHGVPRRGRYEVAIFLRQFLHVFKTLPLFPSACVKREKQFMRSDRGGMRVLF